MKYTLPLVILAAILVAVGSLCLFTVDETEQVVITQFGRPLGETIKDAGLKVKMPWQKANVFPKNILSWDGERAEIPTLDKTYIWVDSFARYRIVDSILYFKKTAGNGDRAKVQLDSILNSVLRDLVQSNPLIEVVRNSDRVMEVLITPVDGQEERTVPIATMGREKMTRLMLEKAQPEVQQLGIELVDLRIKRINYRKEVREKVYERMIAERTRIADRIRSEGSGESNRIEGQTQRELKTIQSDAYRQSQEIKGRADAEAARIYAEAYGKDPGFYSLVKTLDIYKNVPQGEIDIILSTDSDLFKYLKGVEP